MKCVIINNDEKSDGMKNIDKLQEKYAKVLLKTCLGIKKGEQLFISASNEILPFVRVVAKVAYEIGVKEIYFDLTDPYLKHDALLNLEVKDLKKLQFWNKEAWNRYAKSGAAFLMLVSETPGLMKDVLPKKLSDMTVYGFDTRKEFDDLRAKSIVPWCIAAVPTEIWAKEVFPKSEDAVGDLWDSIFDICQINKKDPEVVWNDKIKRLTKRCEKLNAYHFKSLRYTNSLGTDFTIDLPEKHLWASGREKLADGRSVLVNFPTEEVFTSPTNDSAEGILYASKPLCYQDNIIQDFWIQFHKGKVVACKASRGEDTLKQIIESVKNADRLGEVALVPYNSPISEANLVFYETLYDENASCHVALGDSFPECILGGVKMSKEELKKYKMNTCSNHVDFMIGTKDLCIVGICPNGKEVSIFEKGNFTREFE